MKQTNKAICAVFLLTMLTILGGISIAHTSFLASQDKALAFIENVLPVDSMQYSVTLRNFGVPKLPDLGLTQSNIANQEILTYALESKDSTVDVICTIQDDVLFMCNVYVVNGSIISDRLYSNVIDSATSFLQKYQSYSVMDSTKMIDMLANVNPAKNTTVTSGDLKLTVTHQDLTGTVFGDMIGFRWVRTFNGCDYLALEVAFRDGVFAGFIDHRAIYTIGDTSVNISKEQAIKIAMEAIKTYSYRMSDDWVVTGFNVTEDKTDAVLQPQIREANVLYPVWSVTLPLNGTWPGSVRELLVVIWADSGEVDLVHHQSYGGSDLISDGNSGSELPDTSPSSSSSSENSVASVDIGMIAMVAAVATVVAIAASAVFIKKFIKKRSK
jgi:hypothetical protein